jgi:hypothetical protein
MSHNARHASVGRAEARVGHPGFWAAGYLVGGLFFVGGTIITLAQLFGGDLFTALFAGFSPRWVPMPWHRPVVNCHV